MLNYIWAGMILTGVIFSALTGNMKAVTEAALQSAGEGVSLCISTAGIMAFWVGLMEVAQTSGLIRQLTGLLSPFVSFMFPEIPKGHKARDYISTNIIANILGLGWACTPAGLKAMEALGELEAERGTPGYRESEKNFGRSDLAKKERVPRDSAYKEHILGDSGSKERVASKEMCTFLILNISSLQLIPVNMIAYRQQYGSVNPAGIIAPAIVATCISTAVAVVYCKIKSYTARKG